MFNAFGAEMSDVSLYYSYDGATGTTSLRDTGVGSNAFRDLIENATSNTVSQDQTTRLRP